jgi:Fe-S oxidoreductase
MAGSFGYEAEHFDLSMAIGRLLFEQVDASPGETVVAPGASCRIQLATHLGSQPPHPIEVLADSLAT